MLLLGCGAIFILLVEPAIGVLLPTERQLVLGLHNQYRQLLANGEVVDQNGAAMPRGRGIYKLVYDAGVEDSAQKWANRCRFEHTPPEERAGMGQNLYMTTLDQPTGSVLNTSMVAWWQELATNGGIRSDLTIDPSKFPSIGHWSQMAWALTNSVGCGVKWCSDGPMMLVVCNYRPAGNIIGQPVYERGNPCTNDDECDSDACETSSGLCKVA